MPKIVDPPQTEKRGLAITDLITFKNSRTEPGGRAELAHKLSMLSFYLCGMNAVDLFKKQYQIKDGRIEYNRSKTRGKRKDKAFISIKVPYEAFELIEFAAGLPERYSCIGTLNKSLSKGMEMLSRSTGIPRLQYYKLRHTFGSTARNKCHMTKDDIAEALNHVEHGRKTTDIYISKDWSIVDNVQASVIRYMRREEMKNNVVITPATRTIFAHIELPKLQP
ncbi:MAG: hypothetical protein ABIN91_09490 [Mucilaginibacter sp.]|uniref:hypothetical protein n=1 Tax=Mucilaginibacter sp. TaxID=1882438 RepID=UPI003262F177